MYIPPPKKAVLLFSDDIQERRKRLKKYQANEAVKKDWGGRKWGSVKKREESQERINDIKKENEAIDMKKRLQEARREMEAKAAKRMERFRDLKDLKKWVSPALYKDMVIKKYE